MSECNTCNDRRLVGGFLPAWCPDCVERPKQDAEIQSLRSSLATAIAERDEAVSLLADIKFYLQRQDVRAIGGAVNLWDVLNPALQDRITTLTKTEEG